MMAGNSTRFLIHRDTPNDPYTLKKLTTLDDTYRPNRIPQRQLIQVASFGRTSRTIRLLAMKKRVTIVLFAPIACRVLGMTVAGDRPNIVGDGEK
jgi:hypothetical protein